MLPRAVAAFPSPNLIKASTVLSRLPLRPFNTARFLFSSGNPISFRIVSFESNPSPDPPTLDPKTLEALFTLGGDGSCENPPKLGETGGVTFLDTGKVEEAARRPKPNLFPGFGGRGGGRSSTELVLPVFCRVPGRESTVNALCSYFCRIYRSIAPSTSSISIGICALTFLALKWRFDSVLPIRFMLSTCSLFQLSILKDLTLDIWVPSLRCNAAHRIHRKIPKLQLAHPGFRAPQSAHRSFPGTVLISSWRMRSLRACWRLLSAEVMAMI